MSKSESFTPVPHRPEFDGLLRLSPFWDTEVDRLWAVYANDLEAERDRFRDLWNGTRDNAEIMRAALERIANGTYEDRFRDATQIAAGALTRIDDHG